MSRLAGFLITERVVLAAIVLNAVNLFALGFTVEGSPACGALVWVDYFFICYFAFEAILKIRVLGWRGYWSRGWNRFDLVVTLCSLPALLAPFTSIPRLSVVLVLRLGRLVRLLRLLRFIPNRDKLADGIIRALRASVGVFVTLAVVNLVFALGATFLFGDLAPEHFRNPVISIYSTFKIFTVEGWYEIPDLLAERSDSDVLAVLARCYFVVAVLVGGILGLSLANAVFVDEMMMDNNRELEVGIAELTAEVRALRSELAARSVPCVGAGDGGDDPAAPG